MKTFKYIFYPILGVILTILLYISIAYTLTLFPHKGKITENKNQTIYIYHNTMHSDIIINLENSNYNWQKLLPKLLKNRDRGYISFGWGDKETYLNTPSWSDLKISTALKALFTNTPSLIHTSYYYNINKNNKKLKKIEVTKEQHKLIEKKILDSFGQKPIFAHSGYGRYDIFYNSPYIYNLINTCNTWTGNTLREANITMSYWTPFSWCVVNSLP
ncbi:MAG: DUF2459 domain-containing protein [Epsilonproteobacteria bacterium]|nr:DUF2459 domain-containing protein [Campylobacterota bacterium]